MTGSEQLWGQTSLISPWTLGLKPLGERGRSLANILQCQISPTAASLCASKFDSRLHSTERVTGCFGRTIHLLGLCSIRTAQTFSEAGSGAKRNTQFHFLVGFEKRNEGNEVGGGQEESGGGGRAFQPMCVLG